MKKQLFRALIVLVVGAAGFSLLYWTRQTPETVVPEPARPVVRVVRVELVDRPLSVLSQGTVSPRTESVLVPEVSGKVIEAAPSFAEGGFFERGEVLLRIDPHDYEQALVQARAGVAQARLRLSVEQAEARVARDEWAEIGQGEAPPLTLRQPQVDNAQAVLESARAALDQAQRDLERTAIRAPYDGRVRDKLVGLGQFVNRGTPLAHIYAVDFAEIRLPIPDRELAFLDLPLDYRDAIDQRPGPRVVLRAEFAGRRHEWDGRIVRTSGEIDPRSRMVYAVAQVRDPYGRGDDPERPPLAAGMFVEAEIAGRVVRGVAVLPRSALRSDDRVLLVDDEDRIRFRDIDILRRTRDEVIVSGGLVDGERVCLTALTVVTDGMQVLVADEAAADGATDGASP